MQLPKSWRWALGALVAGVPLLGTAQGGDPSPYYVTLSFSGPQARALAPAERAEGATVRFCGVPIGLLDDTLLLTSFRVRADTSFAVTDSGALIVMDPGSGDALGEAGTWTGLSRGRARRPRPSALPAMRPESASACRSWSRPRFASRARSRRRTRRG